MTIFHEYAIAAGLTGFGAFALTIWAKHRAKDSPQDGQPSEEDVRAMMRRIVASPGFCRSARLVNFLRFIVESDLSGNSAQITSYTIGAEAFGRGEQFDPRIDPIVRVEAMRLRKRLAAYFAEEGVYEPLQIEIPLGGYVPVIRRRPPPRAPSVLMDLLRSKLRLLRFPAKTQ